MCSILLFDRDQSIVQQQSYLINTKFKGIFSKEKRFYSMESLLFYAEDNPNVAQIIYVSVNSQYHSILYEIKFTNKLLTYDLNKHNIYICTNEHESICLIKEELMVYLKEFFKLVSDETRLRIVVLLAKGDLYVCQICAVLNLSQPKVSKHLSKLRDLNYVVDERKEKYIRYSLNLKDDVIKKLVQNIIDNIEQYPVLCEDRKQMKDKEIYLSQCKTKV